MSLCTCTSPTDETCFSYGSSHKQQRIISDLRAKLAQYKDSERALAELLKQKMSEAVLQEKLILALQTALAAVTKELKTLVKMNSDAAEDE